MLATIATPTLRTAAALAMLGTSLAGLTCAGQRREFKSRRVVPGTSPTITALDHRILMHVPGEGQGKLHRLAFSGNWSAALEGWRQLAGSDCAASNNAAVAAAMLRRNQEAIARISSALHLCPGEADIEANARVIFADGAVVKMPLVQAFDGPKHTEDQARP